MSPYIDPAEVTETQVNTEIEMMIEQDQITYHEQDRDTYPELGRTILLMYPESRLRRLKVIDISDNSHIFEDLDSESVVTIATGILSHLSWEYTSNSFIDDEPF